MPWEPTSPCPRYRKNSSISASDSNASASPAPHSANTVLIPSVPKVSMTSESGTCPAVVSSNIKTRHPSSSSNKALSAGICPVVMIQTGTSWAVFTSWLSSDSAPFPSTTTRIGDRLSRPEARTVKEGSSMIAVCDPTKMASARARKA